MKEIKIEVDIKELHIDELTDTERLLRESAIEATQKSYAPYSRFCVGAAALLVNGEIVTGNNQENAAYPSGLCAERVALFYASSQYPDVAVDTLAIAAVTQGTITEAISPCGGCRQVLLETEERGNRPMRILLCGKDKVLVLTSAADLLPLSFGTKDLK